MPIVGSSLKVTNCGLSAFVGTGCAKTSFNLAIMVPFARTLRALKGRQKPSQKHRANFARGAEKFGANRRISQRAQTDRAIFRALSIFDAEKLFSRSVSHIDLSRNGGALIDAPRSQVLLVDQRDD